MRWYRMKSCRCEGVDGCLVTAEVSVGYETFAVSEGTAQTIMTKFAGYSFSNVRLCCFSLFCTVVNSISLACGL